MKISPMKFPGLRFLPLLPILALPANAQIVDWIGGTGTNLWSNPANWSGGASPDSNNVDARFNLNGNVQINVDGSYTVRSYRTGNAANVSNTANEHLVYGDTLTIDRNSATADIGILNASANNIKLRLSCDVTVNNTNTPTVDTYVVNQNGANNIIEFGSACQLTLLTKLRTSTNLGAIVFNCSFGASNENLFIGSNNVSFGPDHSSTAFGKDIVFFANSKLAVDGGTVLTANRKFQVNGNGAELELNAADAINGPNIVIASDDFLLDVNADQATMGDVRITSNGVLTIDVDPAVTNLAFKDSSTQAWGTGSVTIIGFKENTIKFSENADGLSTAQLAAIDGGAYTLSPTGYLTTGSGGDNYASWAASQVPPVTGGPNGDDNNDGVKNLVEYALVDGGGRGVLSGDTITFTKRGGVYGTDLTYIIETSETLESNSWSPAVTHGSAELGSPISYTFTPGSPVKEFARLKVVQVP